MSELMQMMEGKSFNLDGIRAEMRAMVMAHDKVVKDKDHAMQVILFAYEQCEDAHEARDFLEAWIHGDWDVIAAKWPDFKDLENHP